MPLNLSTRGSGTSTTPVWTSMRPAEAVVGVLPRVSALYNVVFPDWGRPIIPSFILTLSLGVVYFAVLLPQRHRVFFFSVLIFSVARSCRSGGIGRRARLKIVFRKE